MSPPQLPGLGANVVDLKALFEEKKYGKLRDYAAQLQASHAAMKEKLEGAGQMLHECNVLLKDARDFLEVYLAPGEPRLVNQEAILLLARIVKLVGDE